MPRRLAVLSSLLAASFLSACAQGGGYGPESPHYVYPGGLSIELKKPLTIPPGEAGVRLQYGRTVARNGVQETDPHCIFELDTVSDGRQTVQPEAFRVTRWQRRITTFSGMPVGFRAVALTDFDDGRPSQIYYITEFRLRSEQQPAVRSLTCQHDQAAPGIAIARHLTLAEMRAALGEYFVLDLPR